MTDPYLVSLLACVVVGVFYAALFAIFAAWTASARVRYLAQQYVWAFLRGFAQAFTQAFSQLMARLTTPLITRRPRRVRLGDISPANSAMTLLEVDVSTRDTRIDLPVAPPASSAPNTSAFPLYTPPPTTAPLPTIVMTLIEQPPKVSEQPDEQATEYPAFRPREGYIPPEWPPKPKQPHMRTYRYILASGAIVDLERMERLVPAMLPWYADN